MLYLIIHNYKAPPSSNSFILKCIMQITIMGCLGFTNLKRTIKKAAALPSTYQPIKHTTLSVKAPYKVIHVGFSL